MRKFIIVFLSLLISLSACSVKEQVKKQDTSRRYTFSWPYTSESSLTPRGGTTIGTEVTVDSQPSVAWLTLRNKNLSKFEKDRQAILSLAGTYKVTFDFLETIGFTENFKPDRPYQSWATEYVFVIEDSETFISLQHIMVMLFQLENGKVEGPIVMKHWRQDWTYEDADMHEFVGDSTWRRTKPSLRQRKGKWSQAVFQVDDSPRYEVLGLWNHTGNRSEWRSEPCWRPLPRREFSVRNDYNILAGTHRIVITPAGWVHEQDNEKLRISDRDSTPVFLAKELGLNRYVRIKDFDISAGEAYWESSQVYWQSVRDTWSEVFKENNSFTLKNDIEGKKLYQFHFETLDSLLKESNLDPETSAKLVNDTVSSFLQ